MPSTSDIHSSTTSAVLDNLAAAAKSAYWHASAALRRMSVHRKSATRVVAAGAFALCVLWVTRATYYVRTDPRIEPGSNVVALSPSSTIRPHDYNFSLALVDYKPVQAAVSSGWWTRLRPAYDRDALTQATSVTVQALGPGTTCRTFQLAAGQVGVYRLGDATIEFSGMYSGHARFKIDRYSAVYTSQLRIWTGSMSEIAGTDVTIGVASVPASGDAEGSTAVTDPLKMVYTVSTRNTAEAAVTRSAAPGSLVRLGQVEAQVIGIRPNEVIFSARSEPPPHTVNEGCDCRDRCATAQSDATHANPFVAQSPPIR